MAFLNFSTISPIAQKNISANAKSYEVIIFWADNISLKRRDEIASDFFLRKTGKFGKLVSYDTKTDDPTYIYQALKNIPGITSVSIHEYAKAASVSAPVSSVVSAPILISAQTPSAQLPTPLVTDVTPTVSTPPVSQAGFGEGFPIIAIGVLYLLILGFGFLARKR